ncbi:hypothetical protein ABIC83_000837 [Roseateles asaccharophilus]
MGDGHPADDAVAHVLGIELGVFLGRGVGSRLHGVLEAGGLEGAVPGLDALLHIGHQRGGGGLVDVPDQRLDRLADRGAGVLLLQPPARDEALAAGFLQAVAVVQPLHAEEADAVVQQARHHGFLRQLHDAVGQVQRHAARGLHGRHDRHTRQRGHGRRRDVVGLHGVHAHAAGEGLGLLDVAAAAVQVAPHHGAGAEVAHLRVEQPRDLDDRRAALGKGLHREDGQYGVALGQAHGVGQHVARRGHGAVRHQLQQHAVLVQHEAQHVLVERAAHMLLPRRHGRRVGHHQQRLLQQILGDLEVQLVLQVVDDEQPLLRLGLGRDDAVIGLGLAGVGQRHRRPGRRGGGGRRRGAGRRRRGGPRRQRLRHGLAGGQREGQQREPGSAQGLVCHRIPG